MPASRTPEAAVPEQLWKVGELARRTGLTVRTLHHYDAIGLLSPSGRTGSNHGSGHRLYTAADVARLQQVASLRMLGFGLDEIKEYLSRADYDPRRVVRLHLERVRGQAEELARLADKLAALATALDAAEAVSADTFLATTREITMSEKYYTPEQQEYLRKRREEGGPEMEELIRQGPQMWADYHADLKAAMDAGEDPAGERGRALAKRWFALVSGFTGGDPGVFNSLRRMYENEDTVHGMDVKAMRPGQEWIMRAAAAAGIELPARA
jgi:DNA-binding transcriptional MerR regulator